MSNDELLDDVDRMITNYVAFPSAHHSVVVTLWIMHTWVVNAFYVTPRLILDSAEPGSGKTRVLELLALLCRSAKVTVSTTTAALYRRLAAAQDAQLPPLTVLQDEADAVFGKNSTPQSEDLRALFNAGYRKGATVDRCEGDAAKMRVREFPVHAPVALAGLAGRMPDTITSRGVTLHMRRRRPDQKVSDFRERDALVEAQPIREHLEAWAEAHHEVLAAARPNMPSGVTDRPAEIWEPLLAIADLAGEPWSTKARAACVYFVVDSAADDERLSLGQRLLRDIKGLLAADGVNAMWSSDIISRLTSDLESEWRDLWGKPLDQRRLAKELARYNVRSKSVRIGVATSKGYDVDGPTGLQQAWDHWLAPPASGTSGTADTSQVNQVPSVPFTNSSGTTGTYPAQPEIQPELPRPESVPPVPLVPPTNGGSPPTGPGVCPECQRAPARAGTGWCDFCTAKKRRQQIQSGVTARQQTQSGATARQWFDNYIADLRRAGLTTVASFAVYDAGRAVGYNRNTLQEIAVASPDIVFLGRDGRHATWSLEPLRHDPRRTAAEWLTDWVIANAGPDGWVTPGDAFDAGLIAGYSHDAVKAARVKSSNPRIESSGVGRGSKWRIQPTTNEEAS